MTIQQQLQQKLQRRGDGPAGPETFSLSQESGRLEGSMREVGALGCAVDSLSWSSEALRQVSFEELRKMAQSLSQRLTYLLEPIQLVEADEQGCEIQLRSAPPTMEDGRTSYYEIAVAKGAITFSRWSRMSKRRREKIPALLTFEALGRLARDLSTAEQL